MVLGGGGYVQQRKRKIRGVEQVPVMRQADGKGGYSTDLESSN